MIILDTNVLSELTRSQPSQLVVNWMYQIPSRSIYTTSITRAETLFGLKLMPDGRRQSDLTQLTERMFEQLLKGRVLSFDEEAAISYADVAISRRQAGRPIKTADAMIAAICLSQSMQLATRNVCDFADTGVGVINPFEQPNAAS